MCGQDCCSVEGCSCGCTCGCCAQHHHRHHGHWMDKGVGMEAPVPLMDVDEEIKILEEYRDALTVHLDKVNKRLDGLKR